MNFEIPEPPLFPVEPTPKNGGVGRSLLEKVAKESGTGKGRAKDRLRVLGSERLDRSVENKESREAHLAKMQLFWEERHGIPATRIEVSAKESSKELELRPLIAATSFITGSWQRRFLQQHLDADYFETLSPDELNADAPRLLSQLRDKMGDDVFMNAVADAVLLEVDQKELKALYQRLGITTGVEVEIGTGGNITLEEMERRQKDLDALQHIGIPIGYDAMREVEMPYSHNARTQVAAFFALVRAKLILPKSELSLHINWGGIPVVSGDLFLLDQVVYGSRLLQKKILRGSRIKQTARKEAYEGEVGHGYGVPFKGRKNEVVEYRGLPGIPSFLQAAKTVLSLSMFAEAIASYQKASVFFSADVSDVSPRDGALSLVWSEFKEKVQRAFLNWGKGGVDATYDNSYDYYDKQLSSILHLVATHDELGNEITTESQALAGELATLFRVYRGKIRKVLKEYPLDAVREA